MEFILIYWTVLVAWLVWVAWIILETRQERKHKGKQ
jgi:hypothetical protein